jgi:hypothetical protein
MRGRTISVARSVDTMRRLPRLALAPDTRSKDRRLLDAHMTHGSMGRGSRPAVRPALTRSPVDGVDARSKHCESNEGVWSRWAGSIGSFVGAMG